MHFRRSLGELQENALLVVLTVLGVIVGARDFLGLFVPDRLALLVPMFLVALVLARVLWFQRITSRFPRLPAEPGIYDPFALKSGIQPNRLWPRGPEAKSLAGEIQNLEQTHLLVVGPSGAGKTTLVRDFLIPTLQAAGDTVHLVYDYDRLPINILGDFSGEDYKVLLRQNSLTETYRRFLSSNSKTPSVSDKPREFAGAQLIWDETIKYLEYAITSKRNTVFVFDQIERLFSQMHVRKPLKGSDDINQFSVFFFINMIEYLRGRRDCRCLFIIRSEFLYSSLDFLEREVSDGKKTAQDRWVRHYLCPGINVYIPEAVAALRKDFQELGGLSSYLTNYEHVINLYDPALANTFLAQMFGFVLEHYRRSDPRVMKILIEEGNVLDSLKLYFDYLFNDYLRLRGAFESLEILKISIFALAIENRETGQAVAADRLFQLAHLPKATVTDVLDFLVPLGLVSEEHKNGIVAYRLAHDIIGDYAIEHEQFAFDADLKDSIRGLSEVGVASEKLCKVGNFPNPLADWLNDKNLGLVSIWIFYIFGAAKSASPIFCDFVQSLVGKIWMSRDCGFVSQFYYAIYFTHVVWVTFIYIIDRGYLSLVLKNRFIRTVSKMMPLIGTCLGVTFSQSPALFLVPIISVGILFGVILIIGTYDGSFVGRSAKKNLWWGIHTIGNMLFACLIMLITGAVIADGAGTRLFLEQFSTTVSGWTNGWVVLTVGQIQTGWMYAMCVVMIYYWWQIRVPQQGRIALAAGLAVHDRALAEG